jgi:hypothetical protein
MEIRKTRIMRDIADRTPRDSRLKNACKVCEKFSAGEFRRFKMDMNSFEDRCPVTERVNDYDLKHLKTYMRLLDAAAEGADWREAVMIIFGLDAFREPQRAKLVHDTHLARARWMTQIGYRDLLFME